MEREQLMNLAIIVMAIGLGTAVYCFIYQIFSMLGKYEVMKKAWEASLSILQLRNKKRKSLEKESYVLYGEMESKNIASRIDAMLSYSGWMGKYRWLTAEIFVAGLLAVSVGEMIIGVLVFGHWLPAVGLVAVTWAVIYEICSLMRLMRRKKINDELLHFEDLLEIYALTNDDILQLIGKAAIKVKGPLQQELLTALYEAENSGQISLAFRRLCNRVENKYFKDLILNLEICSRYLTNYGEVLAASKKILKQDEQNRKRIQKLYRKSFMFTVMFIGIGIISIYAMGAFAGVENGLLPFLWTNGGLARGILIYLSAVILLGMWKMTAKIIL